jgi:predicted O-methyltransferase YrrM
MFQDIPQPILDRMAHLEAIDARDRLDGTPRMRRLRQIPAETGRFIALMAACAPEGAFLEVGTSAGYSSMWIALACRARGARLITFEALPEKAVLAADTFSRAGLDGVVELVQGDALERLAAYPRVAFCFLDVEKELYPACYQAVAPNLVRGGLFLADNATSHAAELAPFIEQVAADLRVDSLVVPVGKGVLLARRVSTNEGG